MNNQKPENLKDDCIFCKIIKKQIPATVVYEDEKILVFKDINPRAKVHLLIIPKIHLESLNSCDQSHSDLISYIMLKLKFLAGLMDLKGYRTVINTEKEGGQEVFHLHFHLLGGNLK